jgi:hypothetical protein
MVKMVKRKTTASRAGAAARSVSTSAGSVEKRVITLAETIGRIAGGAQTRAERLFKARRARSTTATKSTTFSGRSGGHVDAPRKKHRKAPMAVHGVKHSDETIPKANAARRTRRAARG